MREFFLKNTICCVTDLPVVTTVIQTDNQLWSFDVVFAFMFSKVQ